MMLLRHARLAVVLALVTVLVHLAGFAVPALDHLLAAGAPASACGCGDDCTCGCRCCDEVGGEEPAMPSCCSAPASASGSSDGVAIWTGACNCGGHDGDHLLYRAFEPAVFAADVRPAGENPLARSFPARRFDPASRPHDPDPPVPRPAT